MNRVIIMGRLTRDPNISHTQTSAGEDMCIARFTVAVDRRGRKNEGEQSADFIGCTAFGKQAEFAEKYLKRGTKILLEGRIQTGSYTDRQTQQKVYTTDVIADRMEFAESKAAAQQAEGRQEGAMPADGFMTINDDLSGDGLPFS